MRFDFPIRSDKTTRSPPRLSYTAVNPIPDPDQLNETDQIHCVNVIWSAAGPQGPDRFESLIMTGTLTQLEMDNLLHSQLIGRLACIQGDEPYIVPMAYAYEGNQLFGQTSPGLKLSILRQHPKVCFEVDQMIDLRNWKSVILFGTFREIQEMQMNPSRQWLFDRIFPMSTPGVLHGYGHPVNAELVDDTRVKPVLFAIDIQRMTGRFEKQ